MIKDIFNTIKTVVVPVLAAGILVSCKNEARADAAPKQDAVASDTVMPLTEAEHKDDGFAEVGYTIPYIGTVDGEPVELQLTRAAANKVVGNYIYNYDNWGGMAYYLEGKVINDSFVLTDSGYNGPKPSLNFKMHDGVIKGTFFFKDKKHDITLKPAVNIANNPPLEYKYKLVTVHPSKEDDFPETDNNYRVLTQIEIYKGDNLLQTLDLERPAIPKEEVLTLNDYNFDGYLDLVVEIRFPGAIKYNWSILTYLYDKEQGIFVENKSIAYYGVVNMYYSGKEILHIDADGSGNESTETLKWVNDTLLAVKRVYSRMDDPAEYHQEYTIENQRSILTKEYKE